MLGFDTETTGVNFDIDHILTASLVHIDREFPERPGVHSDTSWINPGLPLPPHNPVKIHGITDAIIAERGEDPAETLEAICLVAAALINDGVPLVGMNLSFDLTMLDRNCRRWGVAPLQERCSLVAVDAYVLDKAVDQYRKGKRTLSALAAHYNVPWSEVDAHGSAYDALQAARVTWKIGHIYPRLGQLEPAQVHALQVVWKQQQDASFAAYRLSRRESVDGLDGQWPLKYPKMEPL